MAANVNNVHVEHCEISGHGYVDYMHSEHSEHTVLEAVIFHFVLQPALEALRVLASDQPLVHYSSSGLGCLRAGSMES